MFSPIWGKGNGRGISGFAVNRGAVNRGFTVNHSKDFINCGISVKFRTKRPNQNMSFEHSISYMLSLFKYLLSSVLS